MPSRRFDTGAVRALSWDVDGTLYSARRVAVRYWLGVLAASLSGDGRSAWRATASLRRFRQRMERVRCAKGRIEPDDARIERRLALERRWLLPAMAAVGARPGVDDALRALRSRFRAQVAFSDFEAADKLASLGLTRHFDAVYSGERMGWLKPRPEPFRRILADLDLMPEQLLHIGDRAETDGCGASAAGCRFLLLRRDFRSFRELQTMLAR